MSLWIPHRDADRRLHWYSISVPILVLVPVLAICLVLLLELAMNAPLQSLILLSGMLLSGFILFLVAKVSVYRTGIWFSFGSARMTPRMRQFYRLGYVLMFPGAIMTFLLSVLVMLIHE